MDSTEARKLTLARIRDTEQRITAGQEERQTLSRRHCGAGWVEILTVLVASAGYFGGMVAFASGKLLLGAGGVVAGAFAGVSSWLFAQAYCRLRQADERAGEAIEQDEELLRHLRSDFAPANGKRAETTERPLPQGAAPEALSAPTSSSHPSLVESPDLKPHGTR